jgi:hypothetical protein
MSAPRLVSAFGLALAVIVAACGADGPSAAPTNTGQSCASADQCFAGVDAGAIVGTPICLDKVPGGYCTHSCTADADCCAAPGECPRGLAEVCGPFESTGQMDCFLSCETADLQRSGYTDSNAYCAYFASSAFICRSTGGGANNRKVCVPN